MDIFELAFAKKLGGGSGSGGVTINNQDITVTENGTYTAENGYTGLGTVTVDVPTGGGDSKLPEVIAGTVTEMNEADFGGATSICTNALSSRSNLTSVTIPDSITSIGNSAFSGCIKLTTIIIPNSVTSIGQQAFYNCELLSGIVIPNKVTSIEYRTFYGCKYLTSVTIPNSVTIIGSQAFYGCKSLTSVTIPNSVTTIDSSVFTSCSGLKEVIMSGGVTVINTTTFSACSAMEIYDFTACTAVPTLKDTNAFQNMPSTCRIKVPASLYDEWIAATNWSELASQIVAV